MKIIPPESEREDSNLRYPAPKAGAIAARRRSDVVASHE